MSQDNPKTVLDEATLAKEHGTLASLKANLEHVIQGKPDAVNLLIVALLAEGSVLMEDVPGVGKTTLAKALAGSIDADFSRIQFTPDLLPADILGASIYNPADGSFTFRPGPIFCNVLLADEINRASPRTQSAMLEAMAESQTTIEGECRPLPAPFFVIATENPVEFHGTYPLPEAQLDRFMMVIDLGYPDPDTEVDILHAQASEHPLDSISPVLDRERMVKLQQLVRKVRVERSVSHYIVNIVGLTRNDPRVKLGASPRGSLMLFAAARAAALSEGRDFVLPDDVQALAAPILGHRIVLTPKAKYEGVTKRRIVEHIVEQVPVPT